MERGPMFESRHVYGFEVGPPRRVQFDLSTWEGRMAARAAERRLAAETEQHLKEEAREAAYRATLATGRAALPEGTDWLNGWALMGEDGTQLHVLIGNAVLCAGCGRLLGLIAVVNANGDDEDVRPADPDWPYQPTGCPICPHPE